jgi:hypothetical protein
LVQCLLENRSSETSYERIGYWWIGFSVIRFRLEAVLVLTKSTCIAIYFGASLMLPRRKTLLNAFLFMIGVRFPELNNLIEEETGNSSKKNQEPLR